MFIICVPSYYVILLLLLLLFYFSQWFGYYSCSGYRKYNPEGGGKQIYLFIWVPIN